jgi:hypothetical protein
MKIYLDRVNDVTYKYAKCYYEISYILGYIKIKNMIKKFIAKGAACRRANLPSTYLFTCIVLEKTVLTHVSFSI